MKSQVKALAIIPAKTDSKRIKRKNLRTIAGLTLLEHSILYAKKSEYIKTIYVSTEDSEVKEIAKKYHLEISERKPELMADAEVADVYVDLLKQLDDKNFTHVVGIQPDHPDRTIEIDKMIDYFINNKYDDLFTVDPSGTRNGSIRIIKAEHVLSGKMSRRVGSMLDDCTNIHTENDLLNAEKNILRRSK